MIQRSNGGGVIDVDDRVELIGQTAIEVMAVALGQRAIDDADGALEPRLPQEIDRIAFLREIEPEAPSMRWKSSS